MDSRFIARNVVTGAALALLLAGVTPAQADPRYGSCAQDRATVELIDAILQDEPEPEPTLAAAIVWNRNLLNQLREAQRQALALRDGSDYYRANYRAIEKEISAYGESVRRNADAVAQLERCAGAAATAVPTSLPMATGPTAGSPAVAPPQRTLEPGRDARACLLAGEKTNGPLKDLILQNLCGQTVNVSYCNVSTNYGDGTLSSGNDCARGTGIRNVELAAGAYTQVMYVDRANGVGRFEYGACIAPAYMEDVRFGSPLAYRCVIDRTPPSGGVR